MSHYAAAENYPFDGDYRAALLPYLADVAAPTNTPGTVNVSWQIYAASSDAQTAFLLWLATPELTDNKGSGRIRDPAGTPRHKMGHEGIRRHRGRGCWLSGPGQLGAKVSKSPTATRERAEPGRH